MYGEGLLSQILLSTPGVPGTQNNQRLSNDWNTPDDIRAGIAAGTRAIGVYTHEEYAKLVLDMVTEEATMKPSVMGCGSEGMMKPGCSTAGHYPAQGGGKH